MNIKTLKNDFLASVVVTLVAIPLCLGIALACGVPLFSGILAGIIGGIVVGLISESSLSVSGPAAGMIALVIAGIAQLGGFEYFLLALVIAGIIQIACGALRAGFIANFVPTNVIQGLLAAIGILIIVKQLPLALGYYPDAATLQYGLKMEEETLDLSWIFHVFHHINFTAIIITLTSLLILISWEKLLPKAAKFFPAAILVVILSVALNAVFKIINPSLLLPSTHLVNMPVNETLSQFLMQFIHPKFSALRNPDIYFYAIMIAIVASLESLLNLEAVEKLDSRHRYTSRNRELVAQGCGNVISGLLGGLPITSVIVRSSVNINAGGKTKLSAIFHGVILLFSITFFSRYLNAIPLAALAAILIYTGYKLASLSLFQEAYREGVRYFIPFVVTTVAIVFAKVQRLILPQQVTFLNKAAVIEALNNTPKGAKITIDAKSTDYIDNDILGVIKDFKDRQALDKGILLNLVGFKDQYEIENQVKFISATTFDVQRSLTPDVVLKLLFEGNKRFT